MGFNLGHKYMQKTNSAFKIFLTMVALVSLSACSSGKKVVTADDSADYKGSITLQPLKRRPSTPTVDVNEQNKQQASISSPVVQTEAALDDSTVSVENSGANEFVASEIINGDDGEARLLVDADFDQAWSYLNDYLQTSDLTVFSRNKVAGRFAIGCGRIAAAPAIVKKGGWSFLNRDRLERLEYCALELIEKRGKSYVSVLNRSGVEVMGEFSTPVFERLLSR